MSLKIVFSNLPRNPKKFVFGIQSDEAVKELSLLFDVTENDLLTGDITLSLPDTNRLKTLDIKNQELKNLLNDYAGDEIYILPDVGSLTISNVLLKIPS